MLGANVTITARASNSLGIRIRDKINADDATNNDRTLTLDAGTSSSIRVDNKIGDSQPLAGLIVTQTFNADFRNSVDVTDSNAGTITITDAVNNRNVVFRGVTTADSFVTTTEGYDIFFFNNTTFANAVTFQNGGTLELGNGSSDTLTFNGGMTENSGGNVTIDGAIVSSNDAISFGNVRFGTNTSITSAGGAISIGNITSHGTNHDITITSSGGSANTVAVGTISTNINAVAITGSTSVTLNGNITTNNNSGNSVTITGGTINTGAITIDTNNTSNDGAITFDGAIAGGNNNLALDSGSANISANGAIASVGTLTLTSAATATLSGDVDVTTLTIGNGVANVAFTGNGSSVANSFTPDNTGTFVFGASGGTQTYNGGLNTTSVDGTVTLNGTIATSNDAVVLGAVTLGSATTIDTNATSNAADITVAAITGGFEHSNLNH